METGGLVEYKLYLNVVPITKLKSLVENGIIPVGIIFEDVKDINQETFNVIKKYYHEDNLHDTTYLPKMLSLKVQALEELFGFTSFRLTHLIDDEENVFIIDMVNMSTNKEIPMSIRIIKKKKLFIKTREEKEVQELINSTLLKMIIKLRMNTDLTQEQIDEIHKEDLITPKEKIKEWETLDLCAPKTIVGANSDRCSNFNNCHECLVNYANIKHAYKKEEKQLELK